MRRPRSTLRGRATGTSLSRLAALRLEVVDLLRRRGRAARFFRRFRVGLGQFPPLRVAGARLGPRVAPGLDRLLVVLDVVRLVLVFPTEIVAAADLLELLGDHVRDAEAVFVLEVRALELV